MPSQTFDGEDFILSDDASERDRIGYYYDAKRDLWISTSVRKAVRHFEISTPDAKREIARHFIMISDEVTPIPSLSKGLSLKPWQPTAIKFAFDRNRSYLGLDAGLGKAICAAVISLHFKRAIVLISPPFLVENIQNEFMKWAPKLKVDTFGKKMKGAVPDVLIVPDSLLNRSSLIPTITYFLRYWGEYESVLLVDEAHRFKNQTSKRSRILFGQFGDRKKDDEPGLCDLFERQVYFSGTPMPNSPIELYGILAKVAPETINFMNRFEYGKEYCAAYKKHFGWDYSGSSNEKKLGKSVISPSGKFMLRIKKSSVQLPPKIESAFVVSGKMNPKLLDIDKSLGKKYTDESDIIKKALTGKGDDLHLMEYRRMLGVAKIPFAVEYIQSILDETNEAILVFGYHTEVIKGLSAGLSRHRPLVIDGTVAPTKRQSIVDKFQSDKSHRLVIGNYVAMGVGLTLTKASRVIFVEFSWVPGENSQASDRAHRIGQQNTVLVQFMVYQNSLDKRILERILQKQSQISKVMEN